MDERYDAPLTVATMHMALMSLALAGSAATRNDGWSMGFALLLLMGGTILIIRHGLHISARLRAIGGRGMVGAYLLCLFGQLGPSLFIFGSPVSFVGMSAVLPLWMLVCAVFSKRPPEEAENTDRS